MHNKVAAVLSSLVLCTSSAPAFAQALDPHQLGLLQSVQLLEIKLFGRTFFGEPILKRIDRLEEVVGVPHANSRGSLARVDAIAVRAPKTPEERHEAATRAIQAENSQISETMWHNLSVVGIGVRITQAEFEYVPPLAVRSQFEQWRAQFLGRLQQACSAELAATLAHDFGSVPLGAEMQVTVKVQPQGLIFTSSRISGAKELDESVKRAVESFNYASQDTPSGAVSLTFRAVKVSGDSVSY